MLTLYDPLQTQKNVGSSWRGREAYVSLVVRRLQEVLLLGQE